MPEVAVTKRAKVLGWQTYARAMKLPEELRGNELEYLSLRDWYTNRLSVKAQFDEALAQAKKVGDKALVAEFSDKVTEAQRDLVEMRDRVRGAAARSWAEAFAMVAEKMLSPETRSILFAEAEMVLGRARLELKSK